MVAFNGDQSKLLARIANLEAKVVALQKEEERTTIALAHSSVGVFDWRLDTKCIYVSPILQDMLGYEGESMPDHLDDWLRHIHPDDRYRAQKDVREALVYGKELFHAVYQICRKDDATRFFFFQAVIFRRERIEGGDAVRALGTAIDVTDAIKQLR